MKVTAISVRLQDIKCERSYYCGLSLFLKELEPRTRLQRPDVFLFYKELLIFFIAIVLHDIHI